MNCHKLFTNSFKHLNFNPHYTLTQCQILYLNISLKKIIATYIFPVFHFPFIFHKSLHILPQCRVKILWDYNTKIKRLLFLYLLQILVLLLKNTHCHYLHLKKTKNIYREFLLESKYYIVITRIINNILPLNSPFRFVLKITLMYNSNNIYDKSSQQPLLSKIEPKSLGKLQCYHKTKTKLTYMILEMLHIYNFLLIFLIYNKNGLKQ